MIRFLTPYIQFLPTPSHGGRLSVKGEVEIEEDFYPRPHMEGDFCAGIISFTNFISTHALTWRATHRGRFPAPAFAQFLPTPSHGGRHESLCTDFDYENFYPRPHMEGDRQAAQIIGFDVIFLPTPSHGGRRFR